MYKCNFILEFPFLLKSASVHFPEWCHKYKQNVKMAGQDAASQITVININLFPTTCLSYSFCIIKLSSGRVIEIGRKGVEGREAKGNQHSWNLRENVFLFKLLCAVTECDTTWSLSGVRRVSVLSVCLFECVCKKEFIKTGWKFSELYPITSMRAARWQETLRDG